MRCSIKSTKEPGDRYFFMFQLECDGITVEESREARTKFPISLHEQTTTRWRVVFSFITRAASNCGINHEQNCG